MVGHLLSKKYFRFCWIFLWSVLAVLCAGQVPAEEKPAQAKKETKGSGDDLAAKTQNPVGAMYSLPFKFTFDYGADNGEATFLNIQPVIPVTVGDWNLINRVIMPQIGRAHV